jgi:hypothetical protein
VIRAKTNGKLIRDNKHLLKLNRIWQENYGDDKLELVHGSVRDGVHCRDAFYDIGQGALVACLVQLEVIT